MTRILEAVAESAAEEGISRVRALRLVVGPRSGALPDALRFAFEVLAGREPARAPAAAEGGQDGQDGKTGGEPGGEGDPIRLLFNGATLEIEEPSVRARCRRCGLEYTEEETPGRPEAPGHGHPAGFAGEMAWALLCPRCGAPAPEFLSGNELLIDYYEGD